MNDSKEKASWMGDVEICDYYLTRAEAEKIAKEYKAVYGFDDAITKEVTA